MQESSSSFITTWINALTKPRESTYAEIAASPGADANASVQRTADSAVLPQARACLGALHLRLDVVAKQEVSQGGADGHASDCAAEQGPSGEPIPRTETGFSSILENPPSVSGRRPGGRPWLRRS